MTLNLYGLPPGADFAEGLARGLIERHGGAPERLARVEVVVNGARLARRLTEALAARGPLLLPRIRLVSDIAADTPLVGLGPAAPPLRRRLEVAQLVAALIEREPDAAPQGSPYDLADSLAALMEEMHDEGVEPGALEALDVGDLSAHWERSLRFVRIVRRFFDDPARAPDGEARLRAIAAHRTARWETAPPGHPIVVAGSTGSRGATALLMRAVARLPDGAVVFPGFDEALPEGVWDAMDDPLVHEDHPQYRYKRLMDELGARPCDVRPWCGLPAPAPERGRLISMAMRPAPVTDQWLSDGPSLGDLRPAAEGVTLLEAPNRRAEALAIALRLRRAAERDETAVLVTPDRDLARRVSAALDRWGIVPDDSAGVPLHLTPPGRLLRQVAALACGRVTIEGLLSLLKHPLVHSGGERGDHLRRVRELEMSLRRDGPPYPEGASLAAFAGGRDDWWCARWAGWLAPLLDRVERGDRPLLDHVSAHMALASELCAGSACPGGAPGGLWEEAAGEEALRVMGELAREARHGGTMSCRDYADMAGRILASEEVRRAETAHPRILIWGLLEARVGGMDLAILGGLDDGAWPARPAPDPWMSREMRRAAGLRLPELAVGQAAHAFQQAAGAPEVWLARSERDAEAETVPSRWVSRLTNLMGGLEGTHGPEALAAMRGRGERWLELAAALDRPGAHVSPEPRPSPAPPAAARPRRYSVSTVRDLLRDPYAVYASKVLRLRKLAPLRPEPDAALRGQVMHAAFEAFVAEPLTGEREADRARLMACLERALEEHAPWPAARRLWMGRLGRVAGWFLDTEAERQARGRPERLEAEGELMLPGAGEGVSLRARADRIDRTDGGVIVYDYKTGTPPGENAQIHFDRQLLLEAMMAERGAFPSLGPVTVEGASYIGVGTSPKVVDAPLGEMPSDRVHAELESLLSRWLTPAQGYTARRAMEGDRFGSDYDHLSRLGEWEVSDPAQRIPLS